MKILKVILLVLLLVVSAVSASDDTEEVDTDTDTADTTSDEPDEDAPPSVIDPVLSNKLQEKKSTADVLITFKDRTTPVNKRIRNQEFPNRNMKLKTLVADLKTHCSRSQSKVLRALESSGKREPEHFQTFWMTNQIVMRDANEDDLKNLEEIDESNIESIAEVMTLDLDDEIEEVFDGDVAVAIKLGEPTKVQWGVAKIHSPQVWETGVTGEGVIVANIDTGVRGTHEALKGNFVGKYGWYDPSGKTAEPNDQNGHGTHTMGTICGNMRGIGVAHGAKWMACKGCASDSCFVADLISCSQFMLCPTLADGTEPDCSKAPHVVSNSWADEITGTWYDAMIDAWNAADIKNMFAIGNSGPDCGTTQYPGNSIKTIGVGSTEQDDTISDFSSRGPTADGRISPLLSAPGSNVFSAYYTSDTAYATYSGTSMACPHVAGVVALLLQGEPSLNRTQVLTCLTKGCVETNSTNSECGGVADTTFPNYQAGHGRIDAVRTLACLTEENDSNSDEEYYY